jgi:hypothetical protein
MENCVRGPEFEAEDPEAILGWPGVPVGDDEPRLAAIPPYPAEVLPVGLRALIGSSGLPAALVGGAGLAAAACALGGRARLVVQHGWLERAILWLSLMAARGAGKSPAQELAFGPLRRFDKDAGIPLLASDLTMESLARLLAAQPALGLDIDELAQSLRGVGEYKRGSGDRGRLLALWTGAPWRYVRVGNAKKAENAVDVRVAAPTVVICGGLQPALHGLLGGEEDGLRPRWLPHLAELPQDAELVEDGGLRRSRWDHTVGELLSRRERERSWRLTWAARVAFVEHRRRWKADARGTETASTASALIKADVHLARVALVLAELDDPGAGGELSAETLERAAALVDFTLDCWRALPEQGSLSLSRRDEKLNVAVERLVAWLEEHGGRATRRQLLRAAVGGVRSARDLDALLLRYGEIYPGGISEELPASGGPRATVASPFEAGGAS